MEKTEEQKEEEITEHNREHKHKYVSSEGTNYTGCLNCALLWEKIGGERIEYTAGDREEDSDEVGG